MKDYKVYLLDFDGTLFDTYYSLTFIYRYAFAKIGYNCTPEQTAEFMHMSVMETCDRLGILDPVKRQIVHDAIGESLDFPENLARIKPYDDVAETLKELHARGKICAVVSGNTEKHITLALKATNLTSSFAFVVGYSPLRKPKPSGDPIFEAMKHLPGVASSEMVYVGDSLQDPETAHNGGIDGILLERKGEYPTYPGEKITTLKALYLSR
jgi:haloacid dehalogenase superfamily, subfamily IA, variant 1 with third motif having Dx(3-4)D or Dx(3-4)E